LALFRTIYSRLVSQQTDKDIQFIHIPIGFNLQIRFGYFFTTYSGGLSMITSFCVNF
jgi:hypothetical protein